MLWWNYCLLKSATIGHTEKKNMRQPTPRRRLPSDYQMSLTKEQEKDREPGTKRCLVAVSSASQEMFIFIWGSPDWWQKGWKITGSSSSLQKHVLKNRFANKEIKPVHPKGNQPWIFIGRTDDEAPVLWPPDVKNWPGGKDSDAGKIEDGRRRGRQRTRWLDDIIDGHEFEQIPGDSEKQGSLVRCSP